ncbi:MAG: FlgD immunoglobulin-like domain containing protein, partial [candidate division WOR-3 bacterium]
IKGKGTVVFDVPRLTSVSKETEIELAVYDVLGKKIKTLAAGKFTPGFHTCSFDGKDENGNTLSQGTYFIIMKTPKYTERTKFVKL